MSKYKRREFIYLDDLMEFVTSQVSKLSDVTLGMVATPEQVAFHNSASGALAALANLQNFAIERAAETMNDEKDIL